MGQQRANSKVIFLLAYNCCCSVVVVVVAVPVVGAVRKCEKQQEQPCHIAVATFDWFFDGF